MGDFLAWYVVVQVAAIAVWPLVARALTSLDDRGWAIRKTAGLLGIAWLLWLVCMLLPVPFTRATLALAVLIVGAVAWWFEVRTQRVAELLEWARARRDVLLAWEGVFLVGFVLFAVLRSHAPAIAFTEKPMDMAFLNGFMAAQRMSTPVSALAAFGVADYQFPYPTIASAGTTAAARL